MSTAVSTRRAPEPVRRLVLIRHAKSDHPAGVADHDRTLSDRGWRDAEALGRWISAHLASDGGGGPNAVDVVVAVSSAARAQQTWSRAAESAGAPWSTLPVVTDADVYEAAPSTLRDVALRHGVGAELILLVGHNPGMGLLARELAAPGEGRAALADGFPTSGIAVLETDGPWSVALAGMGTFRLSSFATPRG